MTSILLGTIVDHMNTSTTRNQVAAEVRAAVARAGLNNASIAAKTGMSHQSVLRKLRGDRAITVEELIDIAEAVGCSASDLLSATIAAPAAA